MIDLFEMNQKDDDTFDSLDGVQVRISVEPEYLMNLNDFFDPFDDDHHENDFLEMILEKYDVFDIVFLRMHLVSLLM